MNSSNSSRNAKSPLTSNIDDSDSDGHDFEKTVVKSRSALEDAFDARTVVMTNRTRSFAPNQPLGHLQEVPPPPPSAPPVAPQKARPAAELRREVAAPEVQREPTASMRREPQTAVRHEPLTSTRSERAAPVKAEPPPPVRREAPPAARVETAARSEAPPPRQKEQHPPVHQVPRPPRQAASPQSVGTLTSLPIPPPDKPAKPAPQFEERAERTDPVLQAPDIQLFEDNPAKIDRRSKHSFEEAQTGSIVINQYSELDEGHEARHGFMSALSEKAKSLPKWAWALGAVCIVFVYVFMQSGPTVDDTVHVNDELASINDTSRSQAASGSESSLEGENSLAADTVISGGSSGSSYEGAETVLQKFDEAFSKTQSRTGR